MMGQSGRDPWWWPLRHPYRFVRLWWWIRHNRPAPPRPLDYHWKFQMYAEIGLSEVEKDHPFRNVGGWGC